MALRRVLMGIKPGVDDQNLQDSESELKSRHLEQVKLSGQSKSPLLTKRPESMAS